MIEGHVAQILNTRELIINRGLNDKVARGMRFEVLADKPLVVTDPETKLEIGQFDRPKVRVRVEEVHERFAVCRTYEVRRVGGSAFNVSMAGLLEPVRDVPVTLKADGSALPPPLTEEESYVKAGDRVRQMASEE